MGALQLTYEPKFKIVHRTGEPMRSHEAKSVQLWLRVDPLAMKMPNVGSYVFSFNNPLKFVDPDGQYPYPIHIRSFAPFKEFGGWFAGDNRVFTTAQNVTSRLSQSFIMNTDNHTYSGLQTGSSPSHHPLLGSGTAQDDKGRISNFVYSNNKDGSTTTSWTSTMAGHNPLLPSPNINVTTNFSLTENKAAGTLGVSVSQKGDAFPSTETMIGDTKGNMLMIGVSPAVGNPYTSLPGEENNRPMMSANFTITMDNQGVFTGVNQGDKTYSVGDWNKMMQATPAVAPTNAGNQQQMNDMMNRGHKE